ncbi:elongation factor 1-delta isoform X2 [Dromiciops gliroides]|uniref:elongation factor 1-delta isoform X2 n=1 Tax=Dromiciops gliroides TaxID=33562 RepID=UPI001CC7C3E9|nr:elongation factor 1-delta isoform X2 [Dromiciops gliroides]
MRTRKPSCPLETVWEDKHKYDEAERLFYEREATQAAAAQAQQQPEEVVNGLSQDDSGDSSGRDTKKANNGKKQKKRKRSPKNHPCQTNLALVGLSADPIWFEKPLFDQAETSYRKKLADAVVVPRGMVPIEAAPATQLYSTLWPEKASPRAVVPKPGKALTAPCTHGSRVACHHMACGIWVNKFYFDRAEMAFVEWTQASTPPHSLDISSPQLPQDTSVASGRGTPDEGYMTAVTTPATPGPPIRGSSFTACWPSPPANGKPQLFSLQAMMQEVWLEKPQYDDAERCFYEAMFDGHPPGKVRLQERGGPSDVARRGRKDRRNRNNISKRIGPKRTDPVPSKEVDPALPYWYFLHKDGEPPWLSKSIYDSAESRHHATEALRMSWRAEAPPVSPVPAHRPASRAVPSATTPRPKAPVCLPHSLPEQQVASTSGKGRKTPLSRKMATSFLVHEKIWFDKFKYDDAERKFYEQMNGPVPVSSRQENGASVILRDIARARENIQKSLAGSTNTSSSSGPSGDHSELVTRISNLEAENRSLRSVIQDLQATISRLETRLCTLEKCSPSYRPLAPQTQYVSPMQMREPFTATATKKAATPAEDDEEDDDIDLFGSDDEEEDKEAARLREERLRQYAEKKAKKPGLIAKSSILLDVKPWDDETDMAKLEECVRSIQLDGLVWGGSKLVPVGYGIRKLQIQCVVEDDKVGTDILEEEITKFEDYVQSVDIAAFNKI